MIERHDPRSGQFWLIDFALSRNGPLGYDNAYLELAIMLHHLQGAGPQRIGGILEALDSREDQPRASMVPVQDLGLLECVRAIRSASDKCLHA